MIYVYDLILEFNHDIKIYKYKNIKIDEFILYYCIIFILFFF